MVFLLNVDSLLTIYTYCILLNTFRQRLGVVVNDWQIRKWQHCCFVRVLANFQKFYKTFGNHVHFITFLRHTLYKLWGVIIRVCNHNVSIFF